MHLLHMGRAAGLLCCHAKDSATEQRRSQAARPAHMCHCTCATAHPSSPSPQCSLTRMHTHMLLPLLLLHAGCILAGDMGLGSIAHVPITHLRTPPPGAH